MSKQTDTSLFIHSSTRRLYQQLLDGISNYHQLGARIIGELKATQAFRQVEQVRHLAEVLNNIPIKEYQLISQYYLIWCEGREGKYDDQGLERVAEHTHFFKAKALSSRGTFDWYRGKNESALYFYNEALKASPSRPEYIDLSKAIAVLKGQEGFHGHAVEDLEKLLPIIRHAGPFMYFDFMNSYAIELCETGRLQEAGSVCSELVASPFVPYYPEVGETISQVKRKLARKRSTVRVSLPAPEPQEARPMAKIIPFPIKPAAQDAPARPDPAGEGFTPMKLLSFILKSVFKQDATDEKVEKVCDTFYATLQDWWADDHV